jgi:AraC-like DNA-binding protein
LSLPFLWSRQERSEQLIEEFVALGRPLLRAASEVQATSHHLVVQDLGNDIFVRRDTSRRGDLSVTEVCFVVGCSSLGTFGGAFTDQVGMPPSTYRRHKARARAGCRGAWRGK